MPSTPEVIAAFLEPRLPFARNYHGLGCWHSLPTTTPGDLAQRFEADADFEMLRFDRFLASPDGELLARAVELLAPPLYQDDAELVLEALQIAAQEKTRRERLVGTALVGGLALLLFIATRSTTAT